MRKAKRIVAIFMCMLMLFASIGNTGVFATENILPDKNIIEQEIENTEDNEAIGEKTITKTEKKGETGIEKEEEKEEVDSDEIMVISEFPGFDLYGYESYETITIFDRDRSDVKNFLLKTIPVKTVDGKTVEMPVTWECSSDIEKTAYNLYTYEIKLPDNFKLSKDLQRAYDNYELSLPFLDVKVVKNGEISMAKSKMPFSSIKNTWKQLSDDELNEYIANNNDYEIYCFIMSLSQSDRELLFSKRTMLQNSSSVDDENGKQTRKKYYEYLLNDFPAASSKSERKLTSTSGYCFFNFTDSTCGATVKYKLSIKVPSTDIQTQQTYTISVTKVTNTPGSTTLDDITFGKGNLNGDYLKLQKGCSTLKSLWDGQVQDGDLYRTKAYFIAVLHASVKKPAYTYAKTSVTNSSGNSIHFNNYSWKGTGSNTLDIDNVYKTNISDSVNIQLHLSSTGISADTWDGVHSTRNVNYVHQKLKVNFYSNGGTISSTSSNPNATSPVAVTKTYNNVYSSASGLPLPSTLGFSKTGYHPKAGAEWKNGSNTWDQADTSLKCTNLYNFDSGVSSGSGTFTRSLYVNWEANNYTVKYNGNGATAGSTANSSHTYGTSSKLTRNGFTKENYIFKGWNTKADGSGQFYGDEASVTKLSSTNGGTVTLYAQWTDNSYTVKYDTNGATSGSVPNQEVSLGEFEALYSAESLKKQYKITYDGNGGTPSEDSCLASAPFIGWEDHNNFSYGGVDFPWYTFNAPFYANSQPDVLNAFGYDKKALVKHWFTYIVNGSESRDSSEVFNLKYYMQNGGQDLINAFGTEALSYAKHWGSNGYSEGRKGISSKHSGNYVYPDEALISNLSDTKGEVVTLKAVWGEAVATLEGNAEREGYDFISWNTKEDGSGTSYSSGDSYKTSKDDTLYAQWKAKEFNIVYELDGGKNNENNPDKYTYDVGVPELFEPSKEDGKFAGWYKDPEFTEEIKSISPNHIGDITLYAKWNTKPEIQVKDDIVLEFYEGEYVTKEDLLSNIEASDIEDGDITPDIRITKIEYSAGKVLPDGSKTTEKEIIEWDNDMPDEYLFDTWYLQIDKEDSPVTHKIYYEVTDKDGEKAVLEWEIKVLYNEYPEVEAKDYRFTIKEAQEGKITYDALIEKGRAWDLEDCKEHCPDGKHDGDNCLKEDQMCDFAKNNLKIIGWNKDLFKKYTDDKYSEPGYVVLNYYIVDQYGKETIRQFIVYISDDGDIEADSAHIVRFIDWKNYQKNVGVADTLPKDDPETEIDERDEAMAAYNDNGGLHVDSVWYAKDNYADIISSVLEAIEKDNVAAQAKWVFDYNDVNSVKEYVKENGIGNSSKVDGLAGFLTEFESNKVE